MILILQHVACEGPGTIASFPASHALPFRMVRLFDGEDVPSSLWGVSHLVVLGGSMSVYQEGLFPFLKTDSRLIEEAIGTDVPTLGICLGAHLIAKVLGAKVVKAPVAPVGQKSDPTKDVRPGELGWYNVQLTKEGQKDRLFQGARKELRVFQWHEDTFDLPRGAALLGRSETCRNQAFRHGKNVYALQFHVEVDGDMIKSWFDTYDPESPLLRSVLSEYEKISDAYQWQAKLVFDNFFSR